MNSSVLFVMKYGSATGLTKERCIPHTSWKTHDAIPWPCEVIKIRFVTLFTFEWHINGSYFSLFRPSLNLIWTEKGKRNNHKRTLIWVCWVHTASWNMASPWTCQMTYSTDYSSWTFVYLLLSQISIFNIWYLPYRTFSPLSHPSLGTQIECPF